MKTIITECVVSVLQIKVKSELCIIQIMNKKSVTTLQSIIISMAN